LNDDKLFEQSAKGNLTPATKSLDDPPEEDIFALSNKSQSAFLFSKKKPRLDTEEKPL